MGGIIYRVSHCVSKQGNKCTALKELYCEKGIDCTFATTPEMQKQSQEKVYDRLAGIKLEDQVYIADKYYGGKFPWRENWW